MYEPYMVAMSHLSDAQELIDRGQLESANRRINFAKWIIGKYKDDFTSEFDPKQAWEDFVKAGF